MGGVDNIPMTVWIQIHADNLHQEEIILKYKEGIPSILSTHKNIITIDVNEKYLSTFYDDNNVDLYNPEFFFQTSSWWAVTPLPHHWVYKSYGPRFL